MDQRRGQRQRHTDDGAVASRGLWQRAARVRASGGGGGGGEEEEEAALVGVGRRRRRRGCAAR